MDLRREDYDKIAYVLLRRLLRKLGSQNVDN